MLIAFQRFPRENQRGGKRMSLSLSLSLSLFLCVPGSCSVSLSTLWQRRGYRFLFISSFWDMYDSVVRWWRSLFKGIFIHLQSLLALLWSSCPDHSAYQVTIYYKYKSYTKTTQLVPSLHCLLFGGQTLINWRVWFQNAIYIFRNIGKWWKRVVFFHMGLF